MTDLLGTPSLDTISRALADPYFKGLAKVEREPSCQPITKMEFKFERRRVTKEDIRELIYREILEYHPQLLKDYVNGTERANFLHPRKQFAHLEESGVKSGPVIPLERKHASLPRSTIVHSDTVHPKEQSHFSNGIPRNLPRTFPAPPRLPISNPGKFTGPVQYEKGNILKDAYNPGAIIRNTGVPPQVNHSYCSQMTSTGAKEDRLSFENERKQIPQHGLASDIAITVETNSIFMPRTEGVTKAAHVNDGIAIDTNLLQAAKAHRKVGTAQFGMSGMY